LEPFYSNLRANKIPKVKIDYIFSFGNTNNITKFTNRIAVYPLLRNPEIVLGSSQPFTIFLEPIATVFACSLQCNSSSNGQIHIDVVLLLSHHKFGPKPVV
jgi:hypothetical protein